jgi:hypothetical protein
MKVSCTGSPVCYLQFAQDDEVQQEQPEPEVAVFSPPPPMRNPNTDMSFSTWALSHEGHWTRVSREVSSFSNFTSQSRQEYS